MGYLKQYPSKKFAIKQILNNQNSKRKCEQELEILWKLDHTNMVRFCEIYETKDKFQIVQELLSGPSLSQYIERHEKIPDEECRELFF